MVGTPVVPPEGFLTYHLHSTRTFVIFAFTGMVPVSVWAITRPGLETVPFLEAIWLVLAYEPSFSLILERLYQTVSVYVPYLSFSIRSYAICVGFRVVVPTFHSSFTSAG